MNQYVSRKRDLLNLLDAALIWLNDGEILVARSFLEYWRAGYALTPASTRRRWKCGR